ncbi:polygalacturonase/pectin methylesterase-like acyl-CoA thioesterase [Granulicella arctica]|uniref:Polygalacturonase/pectin methylesterase-like acyl-CoA thioesterase n=1 Tax=Granulicella arctica TaxID=940613 RepID=A0A7Y9PKM5_9BACT|nr:polygalacturonase/pectin methylesterase-like acyl-CoA thioesterase [Granulicella arctica]
MSFPGSGYFTLASTQSDLNYIIPDMQTNPNFSNGFTVAVGLGPMQNSLEHLFSILDFNHDITFSLLRDNTGHYFIGKRVDAQSSYSMEYAAPLWDPISPCITTTCSNDTIYVSFLPSGQIQLDEIATYNNGSNPVTYNWQSGLTNYGYPVSSWRSGSGSTPPTSLPSLISPYYIAMWNLPGSVYNGNSYPQAWLNRIAIWDDGPVTNTGISSDNGSAFSPSWTPCNSGLFMANAPGDTGAASTQYSPKSLATPCTGITVSNCRGRCLSSGSLPQAPTIDSVVAGNGNATVNWTPGTNSSSVVIASYDILLRATQNGPILANLTAPLPGSFTQGSVSGLINGTTYYVSVEALDSRDTGVESAEVAVTPVANAPAVPQFTVIPGNGAVEITLAQTDPGNSSLQATNFLWYAGNDYPNPDDSYGLLAPLKHFTVLNLVNGTTYGFSAQAYNQNNLTSPLRYPLIKVTPNANLPGYPTITGATGEANGFSMTWTAPTNTGGSAITTYEVIVRDLNDTKVMDVTTNGTTFDSLKASQGQTLTDGQTYNAVVLAMNSYGSSVESYPAQVTIGATASQTTIHIQSSGSQCAPVNASQLDGNQENTTAIQSAINACAGQSSTQIVELTATNGTQFLSGALYLKPNVQLKIDAGVTLNASTNSADFQRTASSPTASCSSSGTIPACGALSSASDTGCDALINACHATNSGVIGSGTIEGHGWDTVNDSNSNLGANWWARSATAKAGGYAQDLSAPQMIGFQQSDGVVVENVTVQNAPRYEITLNQVNGAQINNVTINTPTPNHVAQGPAYNTDGIDPISSTNVAINNVTITAGDDNIAIKAGSAGPSSNITINNATLTGPGHGLSIGSQTNGGVSNVTASNINFIGTQNGIRIKSDLQSGGSVSNIQYNTICMASVANPIVMDANYAGNGGVKTGTSYPDFQSVQINNMYADSGSVKLQGYSPQLPLNITLNNVRIDSVGKVLDGNANISELTDPAFPYEIAIPPLSGVSVTQSTGTSTISGGIAAYCKTANPLPVSTFTVNPAGSGSSNFTSIAAAVNALGYGGGSINIAPGTYKEKLVITQSNVQLIGTGADASKVVITGDDSVANGVDSSGNPIPRINPATGSAFGTSQTYTVKATGNDFYATNLTIQNTADYEAPNYQNNGQAVALMTTGDRSVLRGVMLLGGQDTLYSNGAAMRSYYNNCYIEGYVDYIFGNGKSVFDSCYLKTKIHGTLNGETTITAQNRESSSEDDGYVITNSQLLFDDPNMTNVYLGRPWGLVSTTYFLNTLMGPQVATPGWIEFVPLPVDQGGTNNLPTSIYREYNSQYPTGTGSWTPFNIGLRESTSANSNVPLTSAEVAALDPAVYLKGQDNWNPANVTYGTNTNQTLPIPSPAAGVPGTPTITATTAGNGNIQITWSGAPANPVETGYTLTAQQSGTTFGPVNVPPYASTGYISGLTNGTAATVSLVEVNADGNSAAATATATPIATAPSVPQIGTSSITSTSVSISVTVASQGSTPVWDGLNSHGIYYALYSNQTNFYAGIPISGTSSGEGGTTPITSISFTGLTPSTKYYVGVKAYNGSYSPTALHPFTTPSQ